MNVSFVRALNKAHIAHTDRFYGPGQHTWPYWQDDLHWALPQIMQALA
jgi:diacylglycerol O-acyltransferase / trehalose O-mycolyltransferase